MPPVRYLVPFALAAGAIVFGSCKLREKRSPAKASSLSTLPTPTSPSPPPLAPPPARPKREESTEPDLGSTIDASAVSDKQLCLKKGQKPHAISDEAPDHLLAAMRSALRSVRTIHVHGIEIREIPKIESWSFDVRASRERGLIYRAESRDGSKVQIIQVPGGKTYANGKFLFSTDPVLFAKVSDEWFEVPDALLTVDSADAHPDGPQGVFGMDIGYKAAIASFAQGALDYYPDEQAKWLLAKKGKDGASKQMSIIDVKHPTFATCRSVLVEAGGTLLQLSASGTPLPLQKDPKQGVISGRFRWTQYNKPLPKQTIPAGAVTLDVLEARK